MPHLDWDRFKSLEGAQSHNFENLCRGLIRLHYGSLGEFRALKNQPGVEFHLKLKRECKTLGTPHRWWGWQCKHFERDSSGNLRNAGKVSIEHSLQMTEKHLAELTDWVLWTPYTLSKQDQNWFNALQSKMELHLWAEEEVDTHLSGPGLMLRNTYFGDLIATPEELAKRHLESVQPIKEKWFEEVHQITDAERRIRRMLGEPGSWGHLIQVGKRLQIAGKRIEKFTPTADNFPQEKVKRFIHACEEFSNMLLEFHNTLAEGDLEIIQQQLCERQTLLDDNIKSTPRHLRRLALPIALDATNALDDLRTAQNLLDEVNDFLGVGLIAVLADAGGGKTQLAAEITKQQASRPSGVLLHGRKLNQGGDLRTIARSYSLNGIPVEGFEQILAALDAAAKRSRCRLPIVIDGLNEAENPKNWKPSLASLALIVKAYPNVLVICTLRTGERGRDDVEWDTMSRTNAREIFAEMALPEGVRRIECEGFEADTKYAVDKYFAYFKIDPGEAVIPYELLKHQLTLRIFCQVLNPQRQNTVSVDYFPASLAPLLEEYVAHSVNRIAEFDNLTYSYSQDEVRSAIHKFGIKLWEQKSREIDETQFRETVGDAGRSWDSSIVNLLAQEGLIFRNPGDSPHEYVITPTFDALGGVIVARSLLANYTNDKSFTWLSDQNIIDSFSGANSHALASDIFRAIVALTPQVSNGNQLWKVAPDNYKKSALRFSTFIDPKYIDPETVDALHKFFVEDKVERVRFYTRLSATRAAVGHPLNADFLDKVLRQLTPVAERDLSWTEWIRNTRRERFADILALEDRWKSQSEREASDRLRLKWLMWHLTSTDHELRDIVTRAIYWFGRGGPADLFEEAISSLDVNDPYVPERMLAASYGVAMAHCSEFEHESFNTQELPDFARNVYEAIFSDGAIHSTTHILLREYAVRIVELANIHNPTLFTLEELKRSTPPFKTSDLSQWGTKEEQGTSSGSNFTPTPILMDFANYTIGRLVPERGNYDFEHVEYKATKARILWRIEQLGWFEVDFDKLDRLIASEYFNRSRSSSDSKKTDRYGKKYSWIAFYELSGLLHDLEFVDRTFDRERTSDVDIDPSFPEKVLRLVLFKDDMLGSKKIKTTDWIASGSKPSMVPYLQVAEIGSHKGPWVALDGIVAQQDEERGRKSFVFVRSFIVKNDVSESFFESLSRQVLGGRWLPEKPMGYYTFNGEIPWCSTYTNNGLAEFSFADTERTITVQEFQTQFFLKGQRVHIDSLEFTRRKYFGQGQTWPNDCGLTDAEINMLDSREILVDNIQQASVEYEALIPVCDFGWEGHQSTSSAAGHAVTLAREVADELHLMHRPQEFDLFTKDGTRASLNIAEHSEDYGNNQSFLYMREDLLQDFLQRTDSSLVWAIWGEREYYFNQANAPFRGPDRPEKTHGDIKEVLRYKP